MNETNMEMDEGRFTRLLFVDCILAFIYSLYTYVSIQITMESSGGIVLLAAGVFLFVSILYRIDPNLFRLRLYSFNRVITAAIVFYLSLKALL